MRGGVQVATHERRVVDVRPVDHVRVGKGGVTPPVLRRRVDEDQLRRFAVGGDPLEETVAAAGARVVLRGVGEGEPVPEARRRLHRRLRTAMVELAAAAAAHQAQRPVDGPRAELVDVEAEVQQMPDEAARLGHARQQHPIHRAVQRVVGPVRSHEGGEVAHRQQAGTGHRAARRPVHQVVDPSGADPALDPQMTRVAAHLVTRRQREPPAITRHQRRRRMKPVPHVQPRFGVVHVDGRYRFVVADRADVLIGERHRRDVVGQLDPQLHPGGDGLAVGVEHQRCVEPHAVLAPRHVPLPSAPHQREAVTHEEPVSHRDPALRRHVGHGPVEQARHHPPAAVRYVDEGDPVATGRHHRPQHDHVAAEADPAVTVAGGLGQVDDAGIRGGGGIDGVVRDRVDPLVGADVAELGAALVRLALNDLQTNQTHGAHPRHDDHCRARPSSSTLEPRHPTEQPPPGCIRVVRGPVVNRRRVCGGRPAPLGPAGQRR